MSHRTALRGLLALVATMTFSTVANAQLFRAYLDSTGLDTNPCTLPAPCRLLPAALAAVANGGEIWMLDSANYNTATVTIAKSVSILAVPGAVGSVVAIAGPAISITASGLVVSLRNLVIVPLPVSGAVDGVSMSGASTLTIENSLLANLPGNAVIATGTGKLEITNSIIRNNGQYSVFVQNGVTADISGTKMLNNSGGGVIAQTSGLATTATVSDSIISGGSEGVFASVIVTGLAARVFVTRCTIQNTTFAALDSETPGVGFAQVIVSNSMITNNSKSWYLFGTGSSVQSLGNNHITNNGAATGALTPTSLQ